MGDESFILLGLRANEGLRKTGVSVGRNASIRCFRRSVRRSVGELCKTMESITLKSDTAMAKTALHV